MGGRERERGGRRGRGGGSLACEHTGRMGGRASFRTTVLDAPFLDAGAAVLWGVRVRVGGNDVCCPFHMSNPDPG